MNPRINKTSFGSITIDGETYEHDVLIRLDGKVKKRKKKLSKEVYGTSHVISLAEAEYVYEEGAELLILGTGQSGLVNLSDEACQFFSSKGISCLLTDTPDAIEEWNNCQGRVIGLFHVTC